MEAKAPKIGINAARDLFRAVREVATQLLRGILAVALKKRSPGREAESLDFPVEFGEQEGFTFAQEEELLDTAPIVLREIVAENFRYSVSVCWKAASLSLETKKR